MNDCEHKSFRSMDVPMVTPHIGIVRCNDCQACFVVDENNNKTPVGFDAVLKMRAAWLGIEWSGK